MTVYCSKSEAGLYAAVSVIYSEQKDCQCIFVSPADKYADMINIIEDDETVCKGKVLVAKLFGFGALKQIEKRAKNKNGKTLDQVLTALKPFILSKENPPHEISL